MPVARVVTRVPGEAAVVCRYLRARGYTVEVVAPESVPDTPADLELRVECCAFEEALQRAQEFARTEEDDAMVLVAPGIFQAPEPKPALASPGVQAATVEAATTQAAAPFSSRPSPWSQALGAALRDAAQALRWAGSEAGDKLGRATSGLGAWRRSLAAAMQPQTAGAAARTRRAGQRSWRRIQEWRAALAVWEAAPWGRTFAATTGMALLLLLLWNGFAGRRAAEHLPPDGSPAAALPAPFAPAVEAEAGAETAAGGEATPAPIPASQRMPAAPQAAPADTVSRREPEVVIRHFEPPARREPARQQPGVKQISDLD